MPIHQQLADSFKQQRTQLDFWLHCLLYACLGLAFLPITHWVATTANEQSRLLHALIVMLAAVGLLVLYTRLEIGAPLQLNSSARNTLVAAYGLLALNALARQFLPQSAELLYAIGSLLSIPAYCCALASLCLFIYGEGLRRIAYTAGATFCAFLLVSIFMAPLDWPLRTLAGKWSGAALDLLGQSVELGVSGEVAGVPPKLILLVNEHPFHVASECNGFGVILTSLLLSVLLAIYRQLGPIDTALNVIAGITLGFLFNTLRILIIVLLAPLLMAHYHTMHEIVGTLTYWGCLILTWILLHGPTRNEP
jgi:exosortase/archaeosortase family protein